MIRPFLRLLLSAALVAGLAGCARHKDEGPVAASVIGEPPQRADPNSGPLPAPDAVLLGATAQGLVRFDAAGQIEPGIASRWDVSADGLYFTFRIDEDSGIDSAYAARMLREAIAPRSRNPLKPLLGAIQEIVAVTPEVVEIRMRAPRPGLLELLARPELAIETKRGGTGPFRLTGRKEGALLLQPIAVPGEEPDQAELKRRQVHLRGEPADRAVARFESGKVALVLGGTFADLGIARAARLPANALRFDPVAGLFGLAVADATGFAGTADNRRALSMTIDRDRLLTLFAAPGWQTAETLVPPGLADLPKPAGPDFAAVNLAVRRALARETVAAWTAAGKGVPRVRVALPPGPGGRMLFALLRHDWGLVGIDVQKVGMDDDADLKLVDTVAPGQTASWYLRPFTCAASLACSAQADAALAAARAAPTYAERNAQLAEADAALSQITAFIPIARPLRWSLVAPRLTGYQDNAGGAHPLNHLRAPARRR